MDDGLQVRWVCADRNVFRAWGGTVPGRASRPGARGDGQGVHTVFAHIGGDIGQEHSWRAGLSALNAKADTRASGENRFTGDSRLCGSPTSSGNGRRTANPRAPSSSCRRSISGATSRACSTARGYAGTQTAGTRRRCTGSCRAGCRPARRPALKQQPRRHRRPAARSTASATPRRTSLMLDYAPSEFSRLRLAV